MVMNEGGALMGLNVVRLIGSRGRPEDWTNIELAEFYRVEASLIRAGLSVETDRGLSDEGHPWFVFCRAGGGEVVLHLARFDGYYIVASPAFGGCARGPDFRSLVERLIGSHLLAGPKPQTGNVYTHPSAALIALASICFFKLHVKEAVAVEFKGVHTPELKGADAPIPQPRTLLQPGLPEERKAFNTDEREDSAVLAAIGIASLSIDVSGAAVVATSTTGAAPPDSTTLFSPHHAGSLDGASLMDQGAPVVDGSIYTGLTADLSPSPIPAVVIGVRLSQPVSGRFGSIVPMATDASKDVNHSNDLQFGPPAHHLIGKIAAAATDSPTAAGASDPGSAASTSSDASSFASTSSFDPPPALTATSAGRAVISVLGDSLQTHFVVGPSAADNELLSDIAPKQSVPGDSPATTSKETVQSTTNEAPINTGGSNATGVSHTNGASDGTSDPAGAGSTTTGEAPVLSSEIANATQDVIQFEKDYPGFLVFDIGKEVVIVDVHLTPSNIPTALHETLSFSDGSSILLIGLPTHHASNFIL
jgi:hypothetical protein